ncbi:MAG TPA: hypothetical protein VMD99_02130 [Terriglobales bacterium]|nr:hypothetical protein [Terriglobales bacterium]
MKLILLAACEKAISDAETRAVSLITVMTRAEVRSRVTQEPPAVENMPPNAIIPMTWSVVALLTPTPGDIGPQFIQQVEVFWPNGDVFVKGSLPFKFVNTFAHPNIVNFVGFPAGQAGDVVIHMWIEQDGKRVLENSQYSILVAHTT